jgi:ribonucleoside-diphosphate reductase alpha chain
VRAAGAPALQPQGSRSAAQQSFLGSCPECRSGNLAYEEGCMKCHVCGFSECG